MELGYLLIDGLGGPFACHMGHIGLGLHPKSKQALMHMNENFVDISYELVSPSDHDQHHFD